VSLDPTAAPPLRLAALLARLMFREGLCPDLLAAKRALLSASPFPPPAWSLLSVLTAYEEVAAQVNEGIAAEERAPLGHPSGAP